MHWGKQLHSNFSPLLIRKLINSSEYLDKQTNPLIPQIGIPSENSSNWAINFHVGNAYKLVVCYVLTTVLIKLHKRAP